MLYMVSTKWHPSEMISSSHFLKNRSVHDLVSYAVLLET